MFINDDCFNYIGKINNNSIDCVLTDPPYLISKKSNFKNSLNLKYKVSIDFGEWDKKDIDWNYLFKEYYRVLRPGGTLIIFFDIWKSNIIRECADINRFKQPRVCSWIKNNPLPVNSKINYLSNSTEYFFTFVKGKKPTFNSEYDNGVYRYPLCHGNERFDHPTQKPLGLIKELIVKHSSPGDLILDTFAGTGTTGHACEITGRDYILIEDDKIYFDIIKNRINSINKNGSL